MAGKATGKNIAGAAVATIEKADARDKRDLFVFRERKIGDLYQSIELLEARMSQRGNRSLRARRGQSQCPVEKGMKFQIRLPAFFFPYLVDSESELPFGFFSFEFADRIVSQFRKMNQFGGLISGGGSVRRIVGIRFGGYAELVGN